MGLCKCPQRKVTNIFCYEHRVNVCEHCLMQNHPKCVVDTYRNWITDSVYSPKCGLCDEELNSNETIRLLCLHIVHWDCLDAHARSLPATTAPAGYTCPVCRKMCLFPAANQVSPIADSLRSKMSEVNWARIGLGLPMIDNEPPVKDVVLNGLKNNLTSLTPNSDYRDRDYDKKSDISESDRSFDGRAFPRNSGAEIHNQSYHQMNSPAPANLSNSYSKLSESYGTHSNSYYNDSGVSGGASTSNPRKAVKFDLETPLMIDEDDNKYHRRSPFESLSRWLKQMNPSNKRRTRRKTALYVVVSIIGMIILLMLLFGRNSDYDDDSFDPRAHPNVLVGEGKVLGHEFDS